MLASAMNFAIGFFGYPFEGQYQQSITIEADGVRVLPFLQLLSPEYCALDSLTTPFLPTKRRPYFAPRNCR
jgi:hypothetical protein